jgi:ankyrin repeat protein
VELDLVQVLRNAHLAGASLEDFPTTYMGYKSFLKLAIECKSVQCALYLIDSGADVSLQHNCRRSEKSDDHKHSAYICEAAASPKCMRILHSLLAHGASPQGLTCILPDCIRHGASCKTIDPLIKNGVRLDRGHSLATAALLGRLDIMKILVLAGASINGDPCDKNDEWSLNKWPMSPVTAAAASGSMEALDLLLSHGADINASFLDNCDDSARQRILESYGNRIFYSIQAGAETGNCLLVEYLIRHGASLAPTHGLSPLVFAARAESLPMISLLLEQRIDIKTFQVGDIGPLETALNVAAERGWLPGMRLLIQKGAKIDACLPVQRGRTPLQSAAENGHLDAVDLLLKTGASYNAPHCPDDGITTFQALIECKNLNWIVRSLSKGASMTPPPGIFVSPLTMAIYGGDVDVVTFLIFAGADPSPETLGELTGYPTDLYDWDQALLPLQLAAHLGYLDICEVLIQAGADVDGLSPADLARASDMTPLAYACSSDCVLVAEYLISKGACIYGKSDYHENSPLFSAITRGKVELVKLLLDHGHDPNSFDGAQDLLSDIESNWRAPTPLMVACGCDTLSDKRYDIVQLLLDKGADLDDGSGPESHSPLLIVCASWGPDWVTARLLIARGAEIDPKNDYVNHEDRSIVRRIIVADDLDMNEILLSRGADVLLRQSRKSTTILQFAAGAGNVMIAEALLKAGARVDEAPPTQDGKTAIQAAAANGRLQMLSLLLCHYRGPQDIADICEDAVTHAREGRHEYLVGYLQEYKQKHLRDRGGRKADNIEEIDDFVNWNGSPGGL